MLSSTQGLNLKLSLSMIFCNVWKSYKHLLSQWSVKLQWVGGDSSDKRMGYYSSVWLSDSPDSCAEYDTAVCLWKLRCITKMVSG